MSKNPNSKSKPVKRDGPMTGAMKFFLAGCVAELYLLTVRRFYVNGTLEQVVAWDAYLVYFLWAGLAVLAAGAVLSILWRADKRRRAAGWWLLGAGGFLAASSFLIKFYFTSALTFLSVLVPVVMLLSILWTLYDRECAWALTILGCSLLALWVCRRELNSIYFGTYVKIAVVVYLVLLAAAAFLAHKAMKRDGMLGRVRVLPAGADVLPVYVACGISAAALAAALISVTAAYYAMWALAIVVFALAVYYTVKQL